MTLAFWDKFNKKPEIDPQSEETVEGMVGNDLPNITPKLFVEGAMYPPADSLERIAKYKRGKKIYDGKTYQVSAYDNDIFKNTLGYIDRTHLYEVYDRAEKLLSGNPFVNDQLQNLYIAVNLVDILIVKPADLMVGEPPNYSSTKGDGTVEQEALNRIVEENDLNQLIHEITIGGGIRGDSWLKTSYNYRQDFSALPAGMSIPSDVKPEPIIEAVDAQYVFPELSRGSNKRFRAVNFAYVEWVGEGKHERPYLNVERHVPGAIIYERFELKSTGVDTRYGVAIETFQLLKQVETGRKVNFVETGVARPLLIHAPHRTTDDSWEGQSSIEKIESVLAAINDRIAQIDYILWKHADPSMSGPKLDGENVVLGGKYVELDGKDSLRPEYIVWDAQLTAAFQELELLIGLVFQMSETPQFIFGTTLAGNGNSAGGTSHTTGDAIKSRYFPLISKVKRIRMHLDKAVREALWTAQILENYANDGVDGYVPYEPQYPSIHWRDGLPRDEKTLAEVAQIRTGGKPTQSQVDAIKELDEVGDIEAQEMLDRIKDDEKAINDFIEPSIFQPSNQNEGIDE